jgi:hypothetical protein
MPRSIANLLAAASTRGRQRAGLAPRHDIEGLPQDPVQSLDWPPDFTGADLVQWVYHRRSSEFWSYLVLPPRLRREIGEDMPLLAFDTFAEPVFDPDDQDADPSGWRQPDWRRDYYPTGDGQGLQHGVEFRYDRFVAHGGRPSHSPRVRRGRQQSCSAAPGSERTSSALPSLPAPVRQLSTTSSFSLVTALVRTGHLAAVGVSFMIPRRRATSV